MSETESTPESEPTVKFCICHRCETSEERKKAEEDAKKAAEKISEDLKQNPVPHR